MSVIIKEDIKNQLEAKVIGVAQYPSLLENMMHVQKKEGKVLMCVDYSNFNKECPKDDFPLHKIHILLDYCAKHEIAFFVDFYARYHQIIGG